MTMTYLMSDVTPILNFCGNAVGGSSLDKGASTCRAFALLACGYVAAAG